MCKSSRTKSACKLLGPTVKTVTSALLYYQTLVLFCQLLYVPTVKAANCDLLVAAASDLAPLEQDLRDAYKKVSPCNLTFTFEASGALRFQIKSGAPYQVFLSANVDYINDLNTTGFVVPDTIRVYAYGRLVLWSKKGYSLGELTTPKVSFIAIANPTYAPYGAAAREALISLGFWDDVQSKLIMAGSVRQAFQFAETGDADACFTSATITEGRAGVVPIDPTWHQPIAQTAAAIRKNDKTNPLEARKFLDFLTGPQGQAVLLKHGLALKPSDENGRKRP
jgi:molybdate transport system substrate-binding protein